MVIQLMCIGLEFKNVSISLTDENLIFYSFANMFQNCFIQSIKTWKTIDTFFLN